MDFPATLPAPLRDGYGIEPQDRVARQRFEAGNRRSRRLFDSAPFLVSVAWRFTAAQFAAFEDWYANDIAHGADEFQIALANGLGMNTVTAAFEGMYDVTASAGLQWRVRASLRVTSLPMLSEAELEVAMAYPLADIGLASPALHTLIHSTLPGYW